MLRFILTTAVAAAVLTPAAPLHAQDALAMRAVRYYRSEGGRTLVKAFVQVPYTLLQPTGTGPDAIMAYSVSARVMDASGMSLLPEPMVWRSRVAASLKALELLTSSTELRDKLEESTKYFRAALTERGLTIKPGTHPIVPIMLGDAALSQKFAARMLEKGVYVIGFFYPVVPHRTARVRTQVSAAHSRQELEHAVDAFAETNKELVG